MCYRTPDCGQRRSSRLTSGNLAPQDVDNGRCPIGENFLYVFKGARSAPRAWRRVTAYAARRESGAPAEGGREAPAGELAAPAAAARLSAVATAAAAVRSPSAPAAPGWAP
jgi:hypothetical protein